MGIINGGTSVGAVLAPPLIALVLAHANWRWIFVLTGGFGFLWTACWSLSYVPTLGVSDAIAVGPIPPPSSATDSSSRLPWSALLRIRETRGLMTAKFLSDAAWFFYLFWLPKYLFEARGFDIKAVGTFAWMPSAAAGLGCLLGGAFSSALVHRRFSLGVARKLALGISAAVMPFVILVPRVPVSWAILLFCLAYFGQQSWSTLIMVLPTDLFPQNVVGSVAGLVGFAGAMGGIVFGQLAGYLLDHGFGYGSVFAMAGTFHIAAFLIVLASIPVVMPLQMHWKLHFGRSDFGRAS
jgi:ACS family hexuronate transporter-like MFS transporter